VEAGGNDFRGGSAPAGWHAAYTRFLGQARLAPAVKPFAFHFFFFACIVLAACLKCWGGSW
jgi:hypothetical protein